MFNKALSLPLIVFALTALVVALLLTEPPPGASANDGDDAPNIPERRELTYPNLGSHLDAVVASYESGRQSQNQAAEEGVVHQNNSIAVNIYLSGNVAGVVDFLNDNGASVRNVGEDYIEAYVPVSLLGRLSQQTGVTRVREIVPPKPLYGDVTSQGGALHQVTAWHNNGYQGHGVKVGVIDLGFTGLRSLMGSELPSAVVGRCYTDISVYTSNLADCDVSGGERHGTGVAEAVIDVAPEVTLYIADVAAGSSADLRHTADWMAGEGVKVINYSVGSSFWGPGDGTSPYSNSPFVAVNRAVSAGIIWVNSAGNSAGGEFWHGSFTDSDSDNIPEWQGTDEYQTLSLEAQDGIYVQMRWDDQWGGATKDLDLYLLDQSLNVVASSTDPQSGGNAHIPWEAFSFTVPADGDYHILVRRQAGSAPAWLQVNEFYGSSLEYYTDSHTIGTPAESANTGLLAVGATPYYDTSKIEPYSSQGPTTDGRTKPDVVGVDCGSSVTYPVYTRTWDNNQQCWFPGTSQSSPHMAGLAALVRQANPSYTPQQTANYLKTNAVDRGASGADNVWGSGFAQLSTAPAAVCDQHLATDGTFNGSWVSGCTSQVSGRGYAKYYSFTLSEQKTVTITLATDDADPYLIVRRESDSRSALPSNEAWYNDDYQGSRSRSQIAPSLPAGTYVIEAATYDSSNTGDFTLTIASSGGGGGGTPPPTDTCTDTISADGTTSGTWAAGCQSQVSDRGYARYYSFTLSGQQTVTITLDSTTDPYLYLRSGTAKSGTFLYENDDHNSSNQQSQISQSLAAGTYTIEATTYSTGETGSFTLTIAGLGSGGGGTPPPTDACAATDLTADGTSSGSWASDCQSAETGRGYARYYGFTTTEAKDVTITLDSDVDTYMYLRSGDKTGAITAQNDDHATLLNTTTACANSTGLDTRDSCITVSGLAAGSYTIEATTYDTATTGNFTLTVSGLSTGSGGTPPPADTCTDTISADGTTSGTWAAGCQSAETGRGYARYYSFTTTESKDVTIVLDSTVDTYLYLRSGDKTGTITAQNDDHGTLVSTAACANSTGLDNTDSCITIAGLTAGSYTIEATTYATATPGSFTLTVSGLSGTGGGTPTACAVNQTLSPGQSCSGSEFTATVASNGNLTLEFTGTTAPPSGLSLTRSGNNWTVNSLP